jgi:hypothetical protein
MDSSYRINVIVLYVEGDDREASSWIGPTCRCTSLHLMLKGECIEKHRHRIQRIILAKRITAWMMSASKQHHYRLRKGQRYSSLKHEAGASLEPSWWDPSERIGIHIGPEDPESEADEYHVRLLKHARQYDLSDIEHLNVINLYVVRVSYSSLCFGG